MSTLDPRLKESLDKVVAKRARIVIDHILAHGFITTEDIANYGYNHPPRAIRDVREHGIPIETYSIKSSTGKNIAAYKFGDPEDIQDHKMGGRQVFSKDLTNLLYINGNNRCFICGHKYEKRYLQIDHRVPYEIAGDATDQNEHNAFMLLCGTCQRKKSWSCEQCENWTNKDENHCLTCYWATPEDYKHIAGEQVQRAELTFSGDDLIVIKQLQHEADSHNMRLEDLLKKKILNK